MAKAFSSGEVVKLTGVSHRQLQWWDECRYLQPEHILHRRQYSPSMVIQAYVINKCGKFRHKDPRQLAFIAQAVVCRYLAFDGVNGKLVAKGNDPARLMEWMARTARSVFVIEVPDKLRQLLAAEVTNERKSTGARGSEVPESGGHLDRSGLPDQLAGVA